MDSPLIIPAHLFPEMTEEERAQELDLMIARAHAIHAAIAGEMSASDLADLIDSQGYEVDDWVEDLDLYGEGD